MQDAKSRCIFFPVGLQAISGRGTLKMNDNTPLARSDLQGLRLIRAFSQVRDQRRRNELIEHAEKLAAEISMAPGSSVPGLHREFAAEQPTDPAS